MPPQPLDDDFDERWPGARAIMKRLLRGRVKPTENLEDFTHTVYDIYLLSAINLGKSIYQLFVQHVKKIYSKLEKHDGDTLLFHYRKQWKKYRKRFHRLGKRCDFLKFHHREFGTVCIIDIGKMVWDEHMLEPLKEMF